MNANVESILVLSQREAKVLEILGADTDYTALGPVDRQLQFAFKVVHTRFQQSFGSSSAFRKQYDVIRIANAWYAPPLSNSQKYLIGGTLWIKNIYPT